MSELALYLFGEPHLDYQGALVEIERRKAFALLAYLAISGRPQTRDVVCALLWPEQDKRHARGALRSTLAALGAVIPETWLVRSYDSLALNQEAINIDVSIFVKLISQSRTHKHTASQMCSDCEPLLSQAADLYRADFMDGYFLPGCGDFDSWQTVQREWLRREISHVLERLVIYYRDQQDLGKAFPRAYQWLDLDPLHEPAHRELMRLFLTDGRRNEALRQYQKYVELLDSELATIPEDETLQLYQSILSDRDTSTAGNSSPATSATNVLPPLPLLVIGRDEAFRTIKKRLGIPQGEVQPVSVIRGWPGVGKSTTIAMLAHDQEVAQAFPDGILWASLGETPDMLAELTSWVDALAPGDRSQTKTIDELTIQLTALLRDRRVLLLVDDIWTIKHAALFRVGGKACAMILTSRLNDVAQQLASTPNDVYQLPILNDEAALELLARLAPETVARYPEESTHLVRDLEGLPLAIQVAGRLLHSEAHLGWDVRELLAELRAGSRLLQSHAPSNMTTSEESLPTIAALLKRSTDLLDEVTRYRFATLGLFEPKPAAFTLEAMCVAWDVADARPTVRILVARGLLEPVSKGRFQMHGLLVLHARSLLDES